ncbi:MAG: FkbM family methyltransferase [Verrucomicrobiota bacterium]|nr:FkbM family methyltransferase [Verrucomicrobiota bacterium]
MAKPRLILRRPAFSLNALENSLHRYLARSPFAARLAAKVRNQANCVIAYHLGESPDLRQNGELDLIRHLAPHIGTFADVGANVGEWSDAVLTHAPKAQGYLFEPSRPCAQRLRERFRHAAVSIQQTAVADRVGKTSFIEEADFGEGSSIAETRGHADGRTTEVEVTTLDTVFTDSTIDFLKIDTEGYDFRVMKGAADVLARTRFVQFEYNSHWLAVGSSLAEASRFLESHGFAVVLIRSTGLHPLRYDLWNDYFRYFAYRPADHALIEGLLRRPI